MYGLHTVIISTNEELKFNVRAMVRFFNDKIFKHLFIHFKILKIFKRGSIVIW